MVVEVIKCCLDVCSQWGRCRVPAVEIAGKRIVILATGLAQALPWSAIAVSCLGLAGAPMAPAPEACVVEAEP